jgi:hypothetical protein
MDQRWADRRSAETCLAKVPGAISDFLFYFYCFSRVEKDKILIFSTPYFL